MSKGIKKGIMMFAVLCLACMGARAESFSIATLNVDGLPQQLMGRDVNPDGPASDGTLLISRYLMEKDYDMVFVQEDFNYHEELTASLGDAYSFDQHSGGIDINGINLGNIATVRFPCDGLGACWKGAYGVVMAERTAWNEYYGRFDHAWDGMVTKGFRRYDVALPSGDKVVVYNMHMDASDDADERNGTDTPDREARHAQWMQLLDDVKGRLGGCPIIVLGDMNSYYRRDGIRQDFIDAIEETGLCTVSDAWVETENGGVYPSSADDDEDASDGETLDKILYINPVNGMKLRLTAFKCDTSGYRNDGKPLGDHFPLSATFEVMQETAIGIREFSTVEPRTGDGIYTLDGRRVLRGASLRKGVYINNGKKMVTD